MKIALAIQCHANSKQINRLIEFFHDEDIDIYIHVDKKSNIINEIEINNNVKIVKDSVDVRWGQISQVEATLKLFNLINSSERSYDYVHLISGEDYPVKSLQEFKDFFKENKNEYIQYGFLPTKILSRNGIDRYSVYYPKWMIDRPCKILKRTIRVVYREFILRTHLFKRKFDLEDYICYGSSWFSITGACMKYILIYLKEHKKYYNFFKNSIYSDEMFFQTIIVNSPFKNHIKNDNLRYIDWSEKQGSPKTLNIDDAKKAIFINTFFARKIVNMDVINFIEKSLN